MLLDLEEFTAPSAYLQRSSVCIAGAGVAGLVLATTLAEAGIAVHLLEAGGDSVEDRSQELYAAEMAGHTHGGTTSGRFRTFGGTSTRWGGQILPFTPDIFCPASGLPSPSWPITCSSVEKFYPKIERILGVDNLPFTTEICEMFGIHIPPELTSHQSFNLRFSKWAPFSHRNLARTLGSDAIASSRISIFLHANVKECLLSPDGRRVEALLVRNYRSDHFRFEADQYVLATGTIEATRILLASRSIEPGGVGNRHDQVGRYVHDHVSAPVAKLNGKAREKLLPLLAPIYVGGTKRTGRLEASVTLRRKLGLLAVMAHVQVEEPEGSAALIARQLYRAALRGELSPALFGNLLQFPSVCFEIFRIAYHEKFRHRRAFSARAVPTLHIDCEQRPTARNRIMLCDHRRDRLDMPKAIIDWQVSSEELATIGQYAQCLRKELGYRGIDGIEWIVGLEKPARCSFPGLRDTNHLMGGTIMGKDPSQSVVDTDLRVHGILNLSIASLSTFPSGGSSNPTFTMMALTLRLGERLELALKSHTAAAQGSRADARGSHNRLA
jgi:choline dehydrogenase-like flavoprotein